MEPNKGNTWVWETWALVSEGPDPPQTNHSSLEVQAAFVLYLHESRRLIAAFLCRSQTYILLLIVSPLTHAEMLQMVSGEIQVIIYQ